MVLLICCISMSVSLIKSFSSQAKVRLLVLTLLPKSKSANTDLLQKIIRYRIHQICIRLVPRYLSISPFSLDLTVSEVSTFSISSFLVIIISIEIAKADTGFLTLFWILRTLVGIMTLYQVVEALNIGDVIPFFLILMISIVKKLQVQPSFRPLWHQESSWWSWFFLPAWLWWVEDFWGCFLLNTLA